MQDARKLTERKLVLIVEENVDALVIYGTSLRHAGYEVIEAQTLEEASLAVTKALPDVSARLRRVTV